MTDSKLFNEPNPSDPNPQDPPDPAPNTGNDAFNELLKGITNENGEQKYADIETALKALGASQSHISKLESENAELRTVAEKVKTSEELLAELQKAGEGNPQNSTFDPSQVAQIVEAQVSAMESQKQALSNQDAVAGALKERFGDDAQKEYQKKAEELGIGVDFLDDLAAKSPAAVLSYFGEKPAIPGKTTSTVAGEGFVTNPDDVLQTPYKTVMGATTSGELMDAWNLSGKRVKARNQ